MATKSSFYYLGDRVPFWGSKTPNELKSLQKTIQSKQITVDCHRKLLKSAFNTFQIELKMKGNN